MDNSLFSTKDIVKYLIVAGLIYTILKIIPSQQITNKDLLLVMAIITIGFVSVDCVFFKNTEGFANQEEKDPFSLDLDLDVDALLKKKAEMQGKKSPIAEKPKSLEPKAESGLSVVSELVSKPLTNPTEGQKISCSFEVEKIKRQLQDEIQGLRNQLKAKTTQVDENKIALKYFESLLVDLNEKGIVDASDIENIKLKLNSNLLTMEEVIGSLETLRKEGKAKVRRVEGKIKDDKVYNELPSDFYSPLGDKIANEWDNEYTILNTNKWQVPMPRPPVCINTMPCKVCPSESSNNSVELKHWDDSRYVTTSKINKKWAEDQADA